MKYILFFFVTASVFAACPPESIEVAHTSPVTHRRKLTCGYMSDGILVKHGPETEFDNSDKPMKTVNYNHGKEGEVVPVPAFSATNLPGAELPSKNNESSESIDVITKLLSIFSYDKSGVNAGEFKVGQCDKKPKEWVMAAVTKKDLSKTYAFDTNCDVSGSFTASFAKPFLVNFGLRNLKEFQTTAMTVQMSIKKAASGSLRYRFEADPATVSAPQKTIVFKAWYEVDVDPFTGVTKFDTQEGKITLLKEGDKVMNIERPLVFNK
jgi:hypothetical protein